MQDAALAPVAAKADLNRSCQANGHSMGAKMKASPGPGTALGPPLQAVRDGRMALF